MLIPPPGSDKLDSEKPITCGFYRLEKGTPLVYEYTYHEMKIIIEGEVEVSDETGQKVKAVAGDVFYFPKGSKITFNTPSHCLAFFVSGRNNFCCIPPC
jgi:ethanolamine utilization protein EutQ (cupin superfamily)